MRSRTRSGDHASRGGTRRWNLRGKRDPGDRRDQRHVHGNISRLEEPIEVHLAQAMCYGYFYCCDKDLDGIRLQRPTVTLKQRK